MKLQRESNKQFINLNDNLILGSGGEARVYKLPNDDTLVAKVYHKPTDEKTRKLDVMIANPPEDPMIKHKHVSIAWPIDLLHTANGKDQVVGFLMPRVNNMKPIIDFYNPKTRRKHCPLFNYLYLHRTAYNLATAVKAIHERGYVIGDLNESNVLVADTALVTLVDTDSFQVQDPNNGTVYRCPVGKLDFTPPELQGKSFAKIVRSPEHDLFGLAVLLFQLLMEGMHPFAGIFKGEGDPPTYEERISEGHFLYSRWWKRRVPYSPMPTAPSFEILSPVLRKLFIQCFVKGHGKPQKRPSAREWQLSLEKAESVLVTCSVNDQHRYGKHLRSCPWCQRAEQLNGRDPFPSQADTQKPLLGASSIGVSRKPRPKPFCLRNGKEANSIAELVEILDLNWEDGKYHLYQGELTDWLKSIGRKELARKAKSIVSSESDEDIGLEKFLQSLGADAPPSPELNVNNTELNFGTVDIERIPKGKYVKKFKISNASRGHLYGRIISSQSWLQVNVKEFSGNSVTVKVKALKPGSNAKVIVKTNGGTVNIPVEMNPKYTWFRTVFIASLIGIGSALGFRAFTAVPLWILNEELWSWLSSSVVYLRETLYSWYNVENLLKSEFYIVFLLISVPSTLALLSAWLWKKIRKKLDLKTTLLTSFLIWIAIGSVFMFIIFPLFLIIAWGIDFAIQPSFDFISNLSFYGWGITGLMAGSAIGILKWLRKIRKYIMYPFVVGGLVAMFFLFRLAGFIIRFVSP